MKSIIVVGLQWGDEGKGKIIDAIAAGYDYVVRWNGGNNAGHTVVVNGTKYPLSLVPSGVLRRKKLLITQGVVINPKVLLDEIAMLKGHNIHVNLSIDPRCHIVMPYHQEMDAANEKWKGVHATGSLHLGIGYCYEDRNNRHGIRLEDLVRPTIFIEKLSMFFPLKMAFLKKAYGFPTSLTEAGILKEYIGYGKKLKPFMSDVRAIVNANIEKHSFLFEQAHGTMLDPVFGTYPYTVAPPTIASAEIPSVGIPSRPIKTLGVVKAYTTRVGNGPFSTEISGAIADKIRTDGGEYGTVSKRPRRVGWLDIPALRYAIRLNGCRSLAMTKLDVLSSLDDIMICTHYTYQAQRLTEFPGEINMLPACRPFYKRVPGWKKDIRSIRRRADLPANARSYIRLLERLCGVPVEMISVGAERDALIWH
jgi:adenylosuccinate synthase